MMRYQRVSPDCLGLPDGRKPTIRACKDNDEETITTAKFPNYPQPLRPRSGSASASANPLTHDHQQQHQHQFPRSFDSIPSENPKSQNSTHHDVLLQWGHRKRSRGSRAENRATGDDSPLHSRQHVKIQRRAAIAGAEKIAAAAAASAMPPPPCGGGGYTRGANLRACTPLRDSTATYHHNRSAEERSGGKRSPQSPPLNHNHHHHPHKGAAAAAAAAHHNNNLNNHKAAAAAAASTSSSMNPEMRNPSDQETIGSGSGGAGTAAAEKVNLEHFEWPRIYVSLSRKEKEDDFLAMKGTKLPQRPKKRPKNIDKSLQYCFPGMWLSDLARGRYDVREKKCVKKKRRGLKGMESMDSDSE